MTSKAKPPPAKGTQMSLKGFFTPKVAPSSSTTPKTESNPKDSTAPTAAPAAASSSQEVQPRQLQPEMQSVAPSQAAALKAAAAAAAAAAAPSKPKEAPAAAAVAATAAAPAEAAPSKRTAPDAGADRKRRAVCVTPSGSEDDEPLSAPKARARKQVPKTPDDEAGDDEDFIDDEDSDSDEEESEFEESESEDEQASKKRKKPPAKATKPPARAKAKATGSSSKPAASAAPRQMSTPLASSSTSSSAGAAGSSSAAEIIEAAMAANAAKPRQARRGDADSPSHDDFDDGPDVKEVSYDFIRDRRDAAGRRPGDDGYDKTTIKIDVKKTEKKLTPAMEQYWDIKKKNADMVLFFKVGKFYELFEEDALLCHRELDLLYMGRGAPHVGFPEASLRKYLDKLVALGHKVGVVEQMETPAELEARNAQRPKGQKKEVAVRRELCEVRTLGTDPENEKPAATYLLSVTEDVEKGLLGVCFVDAATGHFCVGQCAEDAQKNCLRTLLSRLRPAEVVFDSTRGSRESYLLLRRTVQENLLNTSSSARQFWDAQTARRELEREGYFTGGEESWPEALREAAAQEPPLALAAFGGCVGYLRRLLLDKQLVPLGSVAKWVPTDEIGSPAAANFLVLDSKAIDNLEVFENTSDRGTKGTLFHILNQCSSAFGARALREWLCAPPRRVEEIEARQQSVAALMEKGELRDLLKPALKKLPDLERLLARVHGFSQKQAKNSATHYEDIGKAKLAMFVKVLEGFEALDHAVTRAQPHLEGELKESAPHLVAALTHGEGFPQLTDAIAEFRELFDWEAAKKDGRVIPKPGKHTPYDTAEADAKTAVAELKTHERHWRQELRDNTIEFWTPQVSTTEPFQLAVSEETLKRRGTPDEFEMKSSKKGTKRFWTPEIEKEVKKYLVANEAKERALGDVMSNLFGAFSKQFTLWRNAVGCAAELDCLLALAKVSEAPGMCRPVFVDSSTPFLDIRAGVNPCVQAVTDGKGDVIPNDVLIGVEEGRQSSGGDDGEAAAQPPMLLVTGPNMGGKSTLLRQACLTTLMAHLGCWVPAASCRLSPVDRIFTRVGANDAIAAGLSTFRVELEETSLILRHATKHSLVILDELGRGTATFDGMAIASAVMQALIGSGCRTLFATHYHALTREFERPNAACALYHMACVVDDATRHVTFLYKFARGASTRSHGVHVARLSGLPESLLELAARKSEEMEKGLEQKWALQAARRLNEVSSVDEARALQRTLQAH